MFTDDRVVLIRETKTGISTFAVFLASNIVHLIDIFILPLIYTAFYYGFVFPVCSFQWYYLAVLMTSWYEGVCGSVEVWIFLPGLLLPVVLPRSAHDQLV